MNKQVRNGLSGIMLAIGLFLIGCSNQSPIGVSSDVQESPSRSRPVLAKQVGLKGDVAFFGYGSSTEMPLCRIGIKNSNQTIAMMPETDHQNINYSNNQKASISSSGYIVEVFSWPYYNNELYYRIGTISSESNVTSWQADIGVVTSTANITSFDVTVNDYHEVVVVWSEANNSVFRYSTGILSGSTITWKKTGTQFYAPGGLFNYPRISIGGSDDAKIVMVYQPSTSSQRIYLSGNLNYATDYSITWNTSLATTQSGRASTDNIYDIAMDGLSGFSVVYSTRASTKQVYHINGLLSAGKMSLGAVSSLNKSTLSTTTYGNAEVGRASNGTGVVISLPQKRSTAYTVQAFSGAISTSGAYVNNTANTVHSYYNGTVGNAWLAY